jgi:hypothetical protein
MRAVLIVVGFLLLVPGATQAQSTPEIRPFVGALIPTGDQRNVINDATLVGGQLALEMNGFLHLVGTFGYAGPNFDQQVATSGHVHIYQYDLGGEMFKDMELSSGWRLRPFFGLGAGLRTYDLTEAGSENYPAGYGALGSEFQLSRFALRIEARDYLTRFKGLSGNEDAATRNEVALSAGLAYHLR